jgi:hypothetical protein
MNLLPTTIVPNFVTDNEITTILHIIQQQGKIVNYTAGDINSDSNQTIVSITTTVIGNQIDPINDIIGPKLKAIFGKETIFQELWLLDEYHPLGIHTDAHQLVPDDDHSLLYYTMLIPLEDLDSCTIITNQYHEVDYSLPGAEVPLIDYCKDKKLLPKEERITEEFWKTNLPHTPALVRPFFSLDQVFKWRRGSLLAFDRRRWHASDNFLANGITKKSAIVSFTFVNRP